MKTQNGFVVGTQTHVQEYLDALAANEIMPIEEESGYQMITWKESADELEPGSDILLMDDTVIINDSNLYSAPRPSEELLIHHGVNPDDIGPFRAAYVDGKLMHAKTVTKKLIAEGEEE